MDEDVQRELKYLRQDISRLSKRVADLENRPRIESKPNPYIESTQKNNPLLDSNNSEGEPSGYRSSKY